MYLNTISRRKTHLMKATSQSNNMHVEN